ncbi:MAG: hypothetical protein KKA73_07785 [Chloroflexi bacterium]|nr:hypothetical protein [Chloroflexota bacterium]MBU1747573.1 hypothetical protein [Chloroflexota bacterium]MBU1878317.1 hypothetical protein [Chloroflexota bacterium]
MASSTTICANEPEPKGSITPAAIVARLTIQPLYLRSVVLLQELSRPDLTAAELVAHEAELQQVATELETHVKSVQKIVARCRQLPPTPTRTPCPGF